MVRESGVGLAAAVSVTVLNAFDDSFSCCGSCCYGDCYCAGGPH